jgi:hypothetical protein
MYSVLSRFSCRPVTRLSLLLSISVIALPSVFTAGCGGGASRPLSGSTTVTVLASSTANDRLFQFGATIETLTLVSQSGKPVSLLSGPLYVEFTHLNGVAEPLATVSVPQDVYTSAVASLGPTGFTCATLGPNGVVATSFFGDTGSVPASDVTVSLPAPVTVSGATMVLSLDLQVSQSASYPGCYTTGITPFSLTPMFSLAPVSIAARPTNSANGKLIGLEGLVASVDSSASIFVVNSADGSNYGGVDPSDSFDPANGPSWQLALNGSTTFQGISGSSQVVAGMPVDMDAAIQADGSLLATRIAAHDTNSSDTSLWIVPALFKDDSVGTVALIGEKEELGPVLGGDGAPVEFANSAFDISEQLPNLANLPFEPTFTGTNMVAGQNIEPTFHESSYGNSPTGPSPSTVTLLPQTINGTVSATGSEGGFTTYTVTLAPYDLFPALAVQQGQTTLLTNPNTVVVYADANTQMLNKNPVAVGNVARFYGLVFNDNGTLRMDCAQINDGVAE